MEELIQFLNNPENKEKIYLLFVVIGIGLIAKTAKRVIDEMKKK